MIDRSYLPFQSAREYQDSKMQKWMGFFLSEHTSALADNSLTIDFSMDFPLEEKLFLLGQAYASQEMIRITIKDRKQVGSLVGQVKQIRQRTCLLRTVARFETIEIRKIVSIEALEEEKDEADCI